MLSKTRNDFWKCTALLLVGDDYDGNASYTHCLSINPSSQAICGCGNDPSANGRDFPPVTCAEVIAAWLLADDDRRREIEIASRPTKAGIYCRYRLGVRETIETWIVNVETDAEAQEIRDSEGRGLWEPLT